MRLFQNLLFSICFFCITPIFSQSTVFSVTAQDNATVQVEGSLSQGQIMQDLSWAWNSSNACFVEPQMKKFTGNHVLYTTELPTRTTMTITVIPKDEKANFSLYAYSGGGGAIVPNLSRCVSCESDYKWDYKYAGKTQDHSRSVELRAINNPYPVTIGVVGANGLTEGDFILQIKLEPWKY